MLEKDDVIKLAKLARIELTEQEVEKFQKDLSTVLEYVKDLMSVNVEGIKEVSQVTGLVNVQRPDISVKANNIDLITNNAPEIKDGYYKVKAIL
jgi:aspartyl-tRNA(Asn)/glutamyl-tRNA(Gln) amidotransferase subunit C